MVATYLMCGSKKGISANRMKRTLIVTDETAWYLCHRIRNPMTPARSAAQPLDGTINTDEIWVGGKTEGKGRSYRGNKALVVGVVKRNDDIVLQVAYHHTSKPLHEIVLSQTDPKARATSIGEWSAYADIRDKYTRHETVNHSEDEHVQAKFISTSLKASGTL